MQKSAKQSQTESELKLIGCKVISRLSIEKERINREKTHS